MPSWEVLSLYPTSFVPHTRIKFCYIKHALADRHCKHKIAATFTVFMLTNTFHVAVRLFSNRSQMTSSVIYYWTDARQLNLESTCFI